MRQWRQIGLCVLLGFASAVMAQGDNRQTDTQRVAFDIPARPMGETLQELGRISRLNVVVNPELTSGVVAPEIVGVYTPDEALRLALSNTKLQLEYLDEKTVAIVARSPAQGSSVQNDQTTTSQVRGSELAQTHLAQAEGANSAAAAQNGQQTQSADQDAGETLEEIVVTAQKRQERLQDVPISMSVLEGRELDSSTMLDVTEALRHVPGLSLNQTFAGGTSTVAIRGVTVGGLFAGADTTAYYLDTLPFGFSHSAIAPDPDVYDLDRVEVLRGPQGTLYGASALNGVVRVLTKDADPNAFDFKGRTSGSTTEEGGENYRGDLAVNVPLVEGKLAARAVVGYQKWGGWIDRPHRKDANDTESLNLRLKLNAQPTEQLSIGLSAWRSRDDSGEPPTGEENAQNFSPNDEPVSTDYDLYGLKISYDWAAVSLLSSTSYVDYAHRNFNDLTPIGLPMIDEDYQFDATTFAQEINLSSTHAGAWRWVTGAIYRDSKDRVSDELVDFPPPFAGPAIAKNTSESYAVFGDLTRIFLGGKLEVGAGLRYFEDEVQQVEEARFVAPPEDLLDQTAKFSATTKRLVLTWHPSGEATAYASYSEGFRSGAHQFPAYNAAAAAVIPPADPDTLKNYEIGAKGSLMDGRLAYDTAIYYIDWQDIQQVVGVDPGVPELPPAVPALVNTESASGMGVDFGVTAHPVDAVELSANLGWNDLKLNSDLISNGVVFRSKGDRLAGSPEFTGNVSGSYLFPLGSGGFKGRFSVSANWISPLPESRGGIGIIPETKDLVMAAASLSILAREHWTATLFADNLNNERDARAENDVPQYRVQVRPRTVGVQFEYAF